MSSLGQIEAIRSDKSFSSEPARPALPGSGRAQLGKTTQVVQPKWQERDLGALVETNIDETLASATQNVARRRTSTTLASLAIAQEASGDSEAAAVSARETLTLCSTFARQAGVLNDPASARLAIEVLLRTGHVDEAIDHVRALPLAGQVKLVVGAMLASVGRLEEAHTLVDGSEAAGRDAVRGYLQVIEGNDHAAISSLRAALRHAPEDADSSHNLSIAFWRTGARRKAIAAALQSTRSAPGRQDVGLHYLELLLAEGEIGRFNQEVASLDQAGITPSARLLVFQARAQIALGNVDIAIKILDSASNAAEEEGDRLLAVEVQSNLIRIRAWNGKMEREVAVERLLKLHLKHPTIAVVVTSLAQVANRRRHVNGLRDALNTVRDFMPLDRLAFVEHQIASLSGENAIAAEKAVEWFTLDPEDPNSLVAAVVALGIGEERWPEAAEFATTALEKYPGDHTQINNAAYVLAMVGESRRAVELLKPHADDDFVLKATLGLAYLASGQVNVGMKLYREAANEAEKHRDSARSLMTAYQALVVRQLGLLNVGDTTALTAMSLPPVALPDDWEDRPEWLRLHTLAMNKEFGWPLTL